MKIKVAWVLSLIPKDAPKKNEGSAIIVVITSGVRAGSRPFLILIRSLAIECIVICSIASSPKNARMAMTDPIG